MISPLFPRRTRDARAAARNRPTRPLLERLEERKLLYATTGGLWSYGDRITYSFVPDGTSIGGTPSNLFGALNAEGYSNATIQLQFQKAAAVWEAVAGINLAQVADNGAAIGGSGNQQGDPNFGDIRIGGYGQSSGVLGFAFAPPPYNGGSDAGDIFLNTSQSWQVNGSTYDIETVAIHEIGHALGMGHSAMATADMYAAYTNSKQSLTGDDTAGIQSIYGPRPADPVNNNTYQNATNITGNLNSSGQILMPSLDINANSDVDWYYVVAPANTAPSATFTMQSVGLSSLSPRILIYTPNGSGGLTLMGQSNAPGSYGSNVYVTLSGVTAGQGYYIRCQGADSGASGIGAYGLKVNFSGVAMSPIYPPATTVAAQADQGGGTLNDSAGAGLLSWAGINLNLDLPDLIHVGSLTGYGDSLTVSAKATHHHPVGHHPGGPLTFHGHAPRPHSHPHGHRPGWHR